MMSPEHFAVQRFSYFRVRHPSHKERLPRLSRKGVAIGAGFVYPVLGGERGRISTFDIQAFARVIRSAFVPAAARLRRDK